MRPTLPRSTPRSLGALGLCLLLVACGRGPAVPLAEVRGGEGALAAGGRDLFRQVLKHADRDGDGALSGSESGLSAPQLAALDSSGDGRLSLSEWEATAPLSVPRARLAAFRPLVQATFERLDADRSARLAREELTSALEGPSVLVSMSPQVLSRAWTGADRDRDDQVSRAEFEALYLQLGDAPAATRGLVAGIARSLLGGYLAVTSRIATSKALHPKRSLPTETPEKLGMAYEAVSFSGAGGVRLKGWFIPAARPTTRAVILLHGHANNRAAFLNDQRAILQAVHPDHHVLAYDLRAHGESEGEAVSFGYHEGQDALGAIAYLKGRGLEDLAIFGTSLGGATAIRAAALSADIRGVAEDCAYATVQSALTGFIGATGAPLPALVGAATLERANRELGVDMSSTEPVSQVPRIAPRPFLVIHGANDRQVSPDNSRLNFEAAGSGMAKELWIVPGAGHNKSPVVAPEAYQERLRTFLARAF